MLEHNIGQKTWQLPKSSLIMKSMNCQLHSAPERIIFNGPQCFSIFFSLRILERLQRHLVLPVALGVRIEYPCL